MSEEVTPVWSTPNVRLSRRTFHIEHEKGRLVPFSSSPFRQEGHPTEDLKESSGFLDWFELVSP